MESDKIPLITIGITCFNAEDTIDRAIKSATRQDWQNIEIIVVDDCSNDNSIVALNAAQTSDPRIRVYRHEKNLGYPSALNTIVQHAKGEYIAFFDDDDDNETRRLTQQYRRLSQFEKEHPGAPILCYSHRRVVVDGIERSDAFVNAIGAQAPEPYGPMVADFLLWHKKSAGYIWGEFGSCTMMSSKAVLRDFGFDPEFKRGAEWDLAVRVALKGGHFISVDEPLVIQHKTQTLDKSGRKPLEYALKLRKKHKNYLQDNHIYYGAILLAYSRFYYFRNMPWLSRLCLAIACLLYPKKLMDHYKVHRTKNNKKCIF